MTIDNQGNEKVQLVNRYWKIIDANGTLQEVRGRGVVGEQPVLNREKNLSIQVELLTTHLVLWKVPMKCKDMEINLMYIFRNS